MNKTSSSYANAIYDTKCRSFDPKTLPDYNNITNGGGNGGNNNNGTNNNGTDGGNTGKKPEGESDGLGAGGIAGIVIALIIIIAIAGIVGYCIWKKKKNEQLGEAEVRKKREEKQAKKDQEASAGGKKSQDKNNDKIEKERKKQENFNKIINKMGGGPANTGSQVAGAGDKSYQKVDGEDKNFTKPTAKNVSFEKGPLDLEKGANKSQKGVNLSDINLKMKHSVDKGDDSVDSDVSDERNGPEQINNIANNKQNNAGVQQQPKVQPRQGQPVQSRTGAERTQAPMVLPPEGVGLEAKPIAIKVVEGNKQVEEKKASQPSNPSSQESAASTEAKRILPPELNTNKNMPQNIAPVGKSGQHRGEDDIVEDSADFEDNSMSDDGSGEDDEVDESDDEDDGSDYDNQSVPRSRN